MKRMLAVILTMVLMLTVAVAEDGSLIQWSDDQYVQDQIPEVHAYVILPKINLSQCSDKSKRTLHAGDAVEVLETNGNKCKVMTSEGVTGITTTGFIGYGYKILLGGEGTYLFHHKGDRTSQFGTIAAERYNEVVIVLEEEDGYLFVVTMDGRSGYIERGGDYTYYYEDCNNK